MKILICKRCLKVKPHAAKGMCNSCYTRMLQIESGNDHLVRHAESERLRRQRLGDEYRAYERERNKRRTEKPAYNKAYYQRNKEQLKKYQSDFRKSHPEWVAEVKRKYTNKKKGLKTTLTGAEWQAILEKHNHKCAYCGRDDVPLVREHKIPVSRGGHYTADNIVPACGSCNSKKHTLTHDKFLIKLGRS